MPPGPVRSRAASTVTSLPLEQAAERVAKRLEPETRLQALLSDLSSQVRRGEALEAASGAEGPRRLATGVPAIDDLLEGGFPAGRLCEIAGPPSSGRTSLALSLLAHTTARAGELVAVVDRADAFDPLSAEAAGVDLERVLWARAGGEWQAALRCTERLLQTEGIPLIVLDWSCEKTPHPTPSGRPRSSVSVPAAVWIRLVRLAASTRSALIVLSDRRLTGPQADVVLEMQPTRPRFTGHPPLLEEIGARARLVRRRSGPLGDDVEVGLKVVERRMGPLDGGDPAGSPSPEKLGNSDKGRPDPFFAPP
ncbi:MAG: hypothetical protein JRG92_08575 [Deltaproteobacteria bacterium]|nr:hypothetical protein [Deltaproteobacteria bacterium]MBW2383677.1 hypothetical protein [Deltaproteobacteria bacterium]MBW2696039.1 hypothetical protein [Deltaproteobacteria bacterium]